MKKYYLNTFIAIIILFTIANKIQAQQRVPAAPYPIEYTQPDGKQITIRLIGDENRHITITMDSLLLMENKRGYLCYARIDCKGNIKASSIKAHNINNRKKREIRYINKMKKDKRLYLSNR